MRNLVLLCGLALSLNSLANDVTYRKDIRPLWEEKCQACHGADSPSLAEFEANEEHFTLLSRGPRMDSYGNLIAYTGWPDTGALMRRLDDGKNTSDGKPGNMYLHLGAEEGERQANLARFKAWLGEGGWFLGKFKDLDKATLEKIRVPE